MQFLEQHFVFGASSLFGICVDLHLHYILESVGGAKQAVV